MSTEQTKDKIEMEAVDLSKLVGGPKLALDLDEDAWAWNAPPPAGPYKVKIFGDNNGWAAPKINGKLLGPEHKDFYLSRGLECRIVSDNPDYDNVPIFAKVTTRLGRGKNICTALGLVLKMGFKKQEGYKSMTHGEIATLCEAALKREIILDVDVDWQGGYKQADGSWLNVFRTYKDFPTDPENPTGTRLHLVNVARKIGGGSEEIRAMTRIVAWYGKGEERKAKKHEATTGQGILLLDESPAPVVTNATPAPVLVNQPITSQASDMTLLLEE